MASCPETTDRYLLPSLCRDRDKDLNILMAFPNALNFDPLKVKAGFFAEYEVKVAGNISFLISVTLRGRVISW